MFKKFHLPQMKAIDQMLSSIKYGFNCGRFSELLFIKLLNKSYIPLQFLIIQIFPVVFLSVKLNFNYFYHVYIYAFLNLKLIV